MIITLFLSSLSFSQTSHLLTFALFKFTAFFFINYCSVPVCRPIYNLDYNLLSLHNVAHVGSFKAGLVVLDNQSVCSSLEKTDCPPSAPV